MSRRVKLPGADELFRPTKPMPEQGEDPASGASRLITAEPGPPSPTETAPPPAPAPLKSASAHESKKSASGRVKHDEKITVYVTADELLDLEHTRLTLRRDHGLAIDRGRIVREALHLALAGVEAEGSDSALVRRLREQ
jgi:hypothetical protein